MKRWLKEIFPMFDEEIIKQNKEFVKILGFISIILVSYFSFKIVGSIEPIIYSNSVYSYSMSYIIFILLLIPTILFGFTHLTFSLTLSYTIKLPVFISIPYQKQSLINITNDYIKPTTHVSIKTTVIRC